MNAKIYWIIGIVTVCIVLFVVWDAGYLYAQDINDDYIHIDTVIAHNGDFIEGQTVHVMGEVTRLDVTGAGVNIFMDSDVTTPLFYDYALHGTAPVIGDNVAIILLWHVNGNPEVTSWGKLNVVG
jgi:hypothetical protein